ncbi:MAG: DegT/DnrJ/EryC1/StrS family aminotransferase [Verrucomicrobiae bacterium]|nr:DegT/DnrJ/EryC1/StrS family aminotransferase [Verrucomicrobiae bacterium]
MTPPSLEKLAIDGGAKVRGIPWPSRRLFSEEEKAAAVRLFEESLAKGEAFGYEGPEEQAYCKAFAERLGGGFADAVNSGSAAVYVALRALDLEPFGEVIVPAVTDPGGVMPAPLMNLIPVPADGAPGSYNMGPREVEARITPHTRAIIVAHISGLPCDMEGIMTVARARKIPVIEDCAQSPDAQCQGRPVGTFGDLAAFSTMFGKHYSTGGQGGVVFTRDEGLYWKARRAADRGKPFGPGMPKTNVCATLNFNANELSCAIGRVQLEKLSGIVAARRKFAKAVIEGCRALKTVEAHDERPGDEGVFWFLLFSLDLAKLRVDKATFVKALAAEGLPVGDGYFAHSMLLADWFRKRCVFGTSELPWSSPEYKGDRGARHEVPQLLATEARSFRLAMHERCGETEVADTLAILRKVERAYLKPSL